MKVSSDASEQEKSGLNSISFYGQKKVTCATRIKDLFLHHQG